MLIEIQCDKFKTGGKDGEIRPAIEFHEGLNAVVGDDNRSNSIGKSTLLMIIDFVFGGNDYIYKCQDVHENVKEHTINFTFRFDGIEFSFARNNISHQEVIPCNRDYTPIDGREKMSIDDYNAFLMEMYGLQVEDLKWRGLMSKYIRVFRRDTMDGERPLQSAKDGQVKDDIKKYLKQFRRYATVEAQINQAKIAEDEKDAFKKSTTFQHIRMAKNPTEFKANEKRAAQLEAMEKELAESSSKGILDLDSIQAQKLSELNAQLSSYVRQRARVQTQLNSLRREMTEGKKSFKKSYSDLEHFFPGVEFKAIDDIENFHKSLSKVLNAEMKESEKDLATTYVMLGTEIAKLKEEIMAIKNLPNVTQAVLREYARITTELTNVRTANENFTTYERLKATASEYAHTRDVVIAAQLSEIQDLVNKRMKEITAIILQDEKHIPPRLILEKLSKYVFETKGDGGSGAVDRGLITFDLAHLDISNIPFFVHDADLMDPIEKPTLTELIKVYDAVRENGKQAFVSFRSFEFYAEEARPLLEARRVIQLEAKGNELFGWAWNKEPVKEEEQGN